MKTAYMYIETANLNSQLMSLRAVPLINLWGGVGVDGNFFSVVPPSRIMPVAVDPPCRSVMSTNFLPYGNTLIQFFNTHFLYIGPKMILLFNH